MLNEVSVTVDGAKRQRDEAGHGGRFAAAGNARAKRPKMSVRLKTLLQNAKDRHIEIRLMPLGMGKRKANTTFFHRKDACIMWHIEWVYGRAALAQAGAAAAGGGGDGGSSSSSSSDGSGNGTASTTDAALLVRDAVTVQVVDNGLRGSAPIAAHLAAHVEKRKGNALQRQKLDKYVPWIAGAAAAAAAATVVVGGDNGSEIEGRRAAEGAAGGASGAGVGAGVGAAATLLAPAAVGLSLLVRAEDRPANDAAYYVLDPSSTFDAALGGMTIVEYPTVHVVLTSELGGVKLLPPPLANAGTGHFEDRSRAGGAKAGEGVGGKGGAGGVGGVGGEGDVSGTENAGGAVGGECTVGGAVEVQTEGIAGGVVLPACGGGAT